MRHILLVFILLTSLRGNSQYYFPPLSGSTWDTVSPASLGWCTERLDSVFHLLDTRNTKAFIILKDGKIAVEKYFGTFTKDSTWFWASAGKTLTSFMVGVAQQEGYLRLSDSTSKFLGKGWTNCPADKERLITIRHQLTMTTGLNYQVSNLDCTTPSCLSYKADAGTQWYYHNAPYLLLQDVVSAATGGTFAQYMNTKLAAKTGMTGLWYNGVFYSKPRSMARFGSLILNHGIWNSNVLMTDSAYYDEMLNTSQNLNQSYGYLFWLNGKSSFKLPGTTFTFPGSIIPQAPPDLICGLGKYDQKLYIWPSQKMVIVRMGWDADSSSDVPIQLDTLLWKELNLLFCTPHTDIQKLNEIPEWTIYPNPAKQQLFVKALSQIPDKITITDLQGRTIQLNFTLIDKNATLDISPFPPGLYHLTIHFASGSSFTKRFVLTY